MNVCGIVIAHNEDLILPHTIERLGLPYIAILDNPTPAVRAAVGSAWHIIETPAQGNGPHVYNWQQILDLIKHAALFARSKGFDWVLRIDADEDWQGAAAEIEKAQTQCCNIVNYRLAQYEPTQRRVTEFNPEHQKRTEPGSAIHLEPDGNFYHRAWELDTEKSNLGAGGHVILRAGQKVYQSDYHFKHYPAIDIESLERKANREYNQTERKKGWHIQYDGLIRKEKKFHVFYHVAMMGIWENVLYEQMKEFKRHGLLDACASFTVSCVGNPKALPVLPKPYTVAYGGALDKYEFPTLKFLRKKAHEKPDDAYLYLHTKGVSKPASRRKLDTEWRRYMMWGCVENWKECLQSMADHDVAGVEWYEGLYPTRTGGEESDQCNGFFAGNFWWATGKHINSLPEINVLNQADRWQAEAWIGLGNKPRVHEIMSLHCWERKGMFPHMFGPATYKHRDNRYYFIVKEKPGDVKAFNRELIRRTGHEAVVYVSGVEQQQLIYKNFMAVKTEPRTYNHKIEI